MKRRTLGCAMAGWIWSCVLIAGPGPTSLELLGESALPAGTEVDGVAVGGLSGLAFDAGSGKFLALSDDRSEHAPARFYSASIDLVEGKPVLRVDSATTLLAADGHPYPSRGLDPEGIAVDATHLFISSEGEAKVGQAPFVAEFDRSGRFVRELAISDRFRPTLKGDAGVRDNLGFEALGLTPDGRYLFSGAENGLVQESAAASPGVPSLSRLLRWDLERGGPPEELLYRVEAISVTPPSPTDVLVNGLVELIALDAEHLLTLERQWVPGVGVQIRLFAVSLTGLTDVAEIDPPATLSMRTAAKTLILDFADLGLPLDNFEGMTFGPPLPDGRRTLFVVSDDNFNADLQKTFLLALAADASPLTIANLQGRDQRSPLAGRWVVGVEGVVTATEDSPKSKGFWMESAVPDDDVATSDGIYAAWEGAFTLHVGERVKVGGRVEERAAAGGLPVTTLRVVALESMDDEHAQPAALPPPIRLIRDRRIPSVIDDDALTRFEPASDAIDFWESLEGMRVEVPAGTVVSATRAFGDFALLADGASLAGGMRTAAGGLLPGVADQLFERVILSRRISGKMPDLAVGDRIDAPMTGIVDYGFSNFRVQLLAPPVVSDSHASSCGERTALIAGDHRLTLATFNVENFSVADAGPRIARLGRAIAEGLGGPSVVGLEEVQDDSGVADDGVVTSQATLAALVAAITGAGGPRYEPVVIDPENDHDGGQPGGNIRVALLYDPSRLTLVRRGAARANDEVSIVGRGRTMSLSLSPARLAAKSPAFDLRTGEGVRKPLAVEFELDGAPLFVIVNHWTSKWDDDRAFGARQPPLAPTAAKRLAQATVVRGFVDRLLGASPGARIVVLGDFNESEHEPATAAMGAPPLRDLVLGIAAADRYSFNFEGNSELIDHIVVSPALAAGAEADIVHLNTNCPDSLRVSDHDPVVARVVLH
ncbi:MAG: esterase-like activity of phytase family protein [Thermoanaerobaculia bacterium]